MRKLTNNVLIWVNVDCENGPKELGGQQRVLYDMSRAQDKPVSIPSGSWFE